MRLSKMATAIAESPTLKLNSEARRLKEQGEAVIHLGAGEPKSKAPIGAILASASQLSTAEIRYTATRGIPILIKAIQDYTSKNYNKEVDGQNIIVANGAKQSIATVLQAIMNPGDEVIVNTPYWVSYPDMVKMAYGVPVITSPQEGSVQPSMDDIAKKASSKTKAIIINSPNNPSGAIYTEDFIGELVEFCESKDIFLIMDDIYHKLVFDDKQSPNVYKYSKVDIDQSKIIVLNGVSKVYAMTGFRIGWTVAAKEIIKVMTNVQAQTTSCPPQISQAGAAGAINGSQAGVESLRLTLQNNRDIMLRELAAFEGVKVYKPQGTFYCLADFSAYQKDSTQLSLDLLKKVFVVTVPGIEFGMEGCLRMSFCGSVKGIIEGVARIKWLLDPNSPREIYIGDKKLVRA